jgi:hypothetical protein
LAHILSERSIEMRLSLCLWSIAVLLLTFDFGEAQEFRGSVTGRITDSSGAVLVGAAVVLMHVETSTLLI